MSVISLTTTILLIATHSSFACAQSAATYANLVDHVDYLASDSLGGRVPTSLGDSLARTYIANHFLKCGLHPISSDGTYFQSVPILAAIAVDSGNAVTVSYQNKVTRLRRDSEFAVDNQSGCGQVDGEVVFLGYGIYMPERGYNDYGKLSLADKIVICYLYPPRWADPYIRNMAFEESYMEKVERIRSMGGSAVVFVCPDGVGSAHPKEGLPAQGLRQRDIPIIRISENLAFRIMENAGMNVDTLKTRSAPKIPPRPISIPDTRITMKIGLNYSYKDTYNIMGFLKGEDSTQTLVIGAHYDTEGTVSDVTCAGADDNASGVSTVLELARLCASRGHYECNLLFVAFGAEEPGNIGSRFFVNNVPDRIGRIKAMLNFDMVGRLTNNILYVHQVQSAEEWKTLLREIPDRSLDIRFGPNWSATDSGPFYRSGVPVLWFYTGSHRNDGVGREIDSINFSGMEEIIEYSFDLIECISSDAVPLTFQNDVP